MPNAQNQRELDRFIEELEDVPYSQVLTTVEGKLSDVYHELQDLEAALEEMEGELRGEIARLQERLAEERKGN